MTLLAPGWLALLLLAGPVVLLHMRRRRRVVVPSLHLWRSVTAAATPRHALRRPPPSAALFLQLLALLLATLALARPVFGAPGVEHLVLLLDGGGGRDAAAFERALGEVARQVRAAPEGALWSLVLVSERPRPLAVRWPAATTTPADLAPPPAPGAAGADWEAAAALALRLVEDDALGHPQGGARPPVTRVRTVIVGAGASGVAAVRAVVPDAAAAGPPDAPAARFTQVNVEPPAAAGAAPGTWRVTGTVVARAGAAGAAAAAPAAGPSVLRATLVAPGGDARTGSVELEAAPGEDGATVGSFDLALDLTPDPGLDPARDPAPGSAPDGDGGAEGGAYTLELAAGGAAAAFVLHPAPALLQVLYLGPGNAPLERALAALPHVRLERLPVTATLPADAGSRDLVILDRVSVTEAPGTSTWWLGSAHVAGEGALGGAPTGAPERVAAARPGTWSASAPTAGVDWPALLGAAWRSERLPGAEVLLDGADGPLLQVRRQAAGTEVRLSFDLEDGALADSAAFPLFVRDLLLLVEPRAGVAVEEPCAVGVACALPAGTVTITDPRGRPVPLAAAEHAGLRLVAGDFVPEVAGLYRLGMARGPIRPLAVSAVGARLPEPAVQGDVRATPRFGPRAALLAALLLVLLVEARLAWRSGRGARGRLALRAAALALVLLALGAVRLPLPVRAGRLVVVAAPHDAAAVAARAERGAALVLLGPEAGQAAAADLAAADLAAADLAAADLAAADLAAADLAGATELALALVPPGTPGRLVVASDGLETRGDVAAVAAQAAARGVPLDALARRGAEPLDALVSRVSLAGPVLAGDRFALHADVYLAGAPTAAPVTTPSEATPAEATPPEATPPEAGVLKAATLATFRNGVLVAERAVALAPGRNRVSVEVTEEAAGEFRYDVAVTLPGDEEARNDRAGVDVVVGSAPGVLLVSEAGVWADLFAGALAAQGLDVTASPPSALPADPAALAAHGAVVLANVPAAALGTGQQVALEAAVRDLGVPLLLLGGENAFGPGGYYETPLERLSPTSSLVPREAPELAIAFVLDRSNSMRQYAGDQVRLDIAKAAAISAHELLPEGARSALIVFDSTARTLVPLGPAADDAAFRAAITELDPRGGTNLYPALVAAYDELADAGAATAHVIVMSDGLSQPGDFPGILAALRGRGVTVSTIAIGPEADAEQLREVARLGGGAFHASRDFAALPRIMTHEVLLQSGELTAEADAAPAWADRRAPFLRAWPDELPPVAGYVPTSLKPDARLHLSVTDEKGETMPLLASWRHGAGEVVAFTAHAAGPWTAAWLAEGGYAGMWAHLVRQLATAPVEAAPAVRLTRDGDELRVEANSGAVVLELPDGTTRRLDALQVAPGAYLATAYLTQVGTYRVSAGDAAARLHVPYLARLDRSRADPARLTAVARASGGAVVADLAAVGPVSAWRWRRAPAWPVATLAALALLLLELTLRYAPDLLPRLSVRRKDGRS